MDFIDNIYENINIYNSLIIYDAYQSYTIHNLINELILKDYPIYHLNHPTDNLNYLENKYRMFIIPHDQFSSYIYNKKYDLTNISLILCLNKFNYVSKILSNKDISISEDIFVFQL